MKLASLRSGRDGRLVVVGTDLARCADACDIAPTMQAALDDWDRCAPLLRQLSADLERGVASSAPFDVERAAAPLPRAYQWVDASAYVNHVALVRRARGAEMPDRFWHDPLMYQGASDEMLAARSDLALADPAWGADFEAEIVVVTGDVPRGASRDDALAQIRLVGLVNDISLRALIPDELAKGFGFVQSKPACALSPVLVTPDDLGDRWRDGRLHGTLHVDFNGRPFGRPDAGIDMTFDFGTLVAHAARTRNLVAGTILGSGTVSNRDAQGGPGLPIDQGGAGYACLAELRTVETLLGGHPSTPYLASGDTVRIWMEDAAGEQIFGAIEQTVVAA